MRHISLSVLLMTLCSVAWGEDQKPIGKITVVEQRDENPIPIEGKSGKRSACVNCLIFEGDVIQTRKNQTLTLVFDEGTELNIGPSAVVTLDRWFGRDSSGLLSRVVGITRGVMRAIVNKVYSEQEPFLVKTKSAIMGVRGTEFIVAINQERLQNRESSHTVSLFTVTGEVQFAKSESALRSGEFVMARAGYRSVFAQGMSMPTTPKRFPMSDLNSIIKKSLPQVQKPEVQNHRTFEVKEARTKTVTGQTPDLNMAGQIVNKNESVTVHKNAAAPERPRIKLNPEVQVNRDGTRDGGPRGGSLGGLEASSSHAQKRLERDGDDPAKGAEEFTGPPKNRPGIIENAQTVSGAGFDRVAPNRVGGASRPPGAMGGVGGGMAQPRPKQGFRDRVNRGELPKPQLPKYQGLPGATTPNAP